MVLHLNSLHNRLDFPKNIAKIKFISIFSSNKKRKKRENIEMNLIYLILVVVAIVVIALIVKKFNKLKKQNPAVWVDNIEKATINNTDWRHVLHTSDNLQVVAMSVPEGQELGMETHSANDQFFRVESGLGRLEAITPDGNKTQYELYDGYSVVVPHGTKHNLINIGDKPLKLYTIYSPPHHPPGTIHHMHQDEPN